MNILKISSTPIHKWARRIWCAQYFAFFAVMLNFANILLNISMLIHPWGGVIGLLTFVGIVTFVTYKSQIDIPFIKINSRPIKWRWRPVRTWFRKAHQYTILVDLEQSMKEGFKSAEDKLFTISNSFEETYDCCLINQTFDLEFKGIPFGLYGKFNIEFYNEEELSLLLLQYA